MSHSTATTAHVGRSWLEIVRDLVALTKPRITLMVLITAAGGMWLAPENPGGTQLAVALLALTLVVGSANGLNCWMERDTDRLMRRTAGRPLPDQRLSPRPALFFAAFLGVVAVPLLALGVNPITGLLGALSLVLYVWVYTPMKQLTPAALLVGAVPGAMPPLMGWTAATGRIDAPGLVLFGVLFLWQLPHFIAIASFRRKEYEAAGLKVLPSVRGERVARLHALLWAVLLLPVSLLLQPLGVTGWAYQIVAGAMGVTFIVATARGLTREDDSRWAKRVFLTSLIYLPVVFAALMIDAV
jgi:protoheme IX farnesyltransferase